MTKSILRLVVFVVLLAGSVRFGFAADGITKTTEKVAMHDGVHLATDVYRPESQKGPLPVIFMRTPYNKDGNKSFSAATAPHGYVLVVQDMRGRFASEGNDSVVFHNDGWGNRRDGQESVEWIARQPWCNGSIATYGGSALGITQTMMAPNAPSAPKASTFTGGGAFAIGCFTSMGNLFFLAKTFGSFMGFCCFTTFSTGLGGSFFTTSCLGGGVGLGFGFGFSIRRRA